MDLTRAFRDLTCHGRLGRGLAGLLRDLIDVGGRERLREFLLRGGTLTLDDFHGPYEWDNFAKEMRRVFPDREIVELEPRIAAGGLEDTGGLRIAKAWLLSQEYRHRAREGRIVE